MPRRLFLTLVGPGAWQDPPRASGRRVTLRVSRWLVFRPLAPVSPLTFVPPPLPTPRFSFCRGPSDPKLTVTIAR